MGQRSKGYRRKTRRKLSVRPRKKFTVTPYMQDFKKDERVVLKIDPSSHRGMPFPRYLGFVGTVLGKRGRAYIVEIKDGNKSKKFMVTPEHLSRKK